MHFQRTTLAVIVAAALVPAAFAQTPPASAPVRTVIAQAKLPSVVDKPMDFRVVNVELRVGKKETLSSVTSIVYQVSGSADVSVGAETTALASGAALYIPATSAVVSLTAKGSDSTFLVFQLTAAGSKGAESGGGKAKELYRTAKPLPGLKPGAYDINLTRVSFPAKMPSNAPHHRSGGAIYYIVSGAGADTVGGKTYSKEPGMLIYEPAGLVHQWGNPGAEPLVFLAFNINPEGVPAVVQETPGAK